MNGIYFCIRDWTSLPQSVTHNGVSFVAPFAILPRLTVKKTTGLGIEEKRMLTSSCEMA